MKTIKKLIACFAFLVLTMTAAFTDDVAKVGDTTYSDFATALSHWTNGSTLTLLANVTYNAFINISNGSYTLDLNDHGIRFTSDHVNFFIESSLTIEDNATTKTDHYISLDEDGRGVEVNNSGTESDTCVKVTGGYITGAKNNNWSGAILLESGSSSFTMNGGTIVGNVAQNGGGIFVSPNGGTVTICGDAKIIKNTVTADGGAICMMGGSLNVADSVQITGNKKSNGEANNIVLMANGKIGFSGQLNENARIGVGVPNNQNKVITNGLNGNTSNAKGSVSNFISDNPAYTVALNSSGEAFLASLVTVTTNADPSNSGVYYATFYDSVKSYVADANTEVYYATANANGKLTLVKVNDKIVKAGEGVILKSSSATITLIETTQSATYDSILTGSNTATTVTNALVLSSGANGVRFYKYTGSVAAHKAWLTE